jgi:hypothetical protein
MRSPLRCVSMTKRWDASIDNRGLLVMKRMVTRIAAVAALGLATPALADNEQVSMWATSCLPGHDCNTSYGSGGLALESYAYASARGYNGGVVSARAGFSPNPDTLNGTYSSEATVESSYDFKIVGPSTTAVPLHIHGYAFVSPIVAGASDGGLLTIGLDGTPSGTTGFSIKSGASLQVEGVAGFDYYGTPYFDYERVDVANNSDLNDLAGKGDLLDGTFEFISNSYIRVILSATASLTHNPQGPDENPIGGVEAGADPVFTIDDPAFSAFRIVGVPDDPAPIGGAVPEPATWALMILGFGMTCYRMRRRTMAFS